MRPSLNLMLIFCLSAGMLGSCRKFLDAKPDASLSTPSTLEDLQLLLDNNTLLNQNEIANAFDILSDDYYLTEEDYNSLGVNSEKRLYLWESTDETGGWWRYAGIFNVNVVLDEIDKIPGTSGEKANIQGSALFFRAFLHFQALQLFSLPYSVERAENTPGVPLRLESDYSISSRRSSVADCYRQILEDLHAAAGLLPEVPIVKTRPSRPAAFGFLARVHLGMQRFDSAGHYARAALSLYDSLMDYNTLSSAEVAPVPRFNKEVVFHARSLVSSAIFGARARVSPSLISLYQTGDLRRKVFFRDNADGSINFKGDYDGRGPNQNGFSFTGVVTDELYLIAAECHARKGETVAALDYLNRLLETRYEPGAFQPVSMTDPDTLLKFILTERRKELLFRGLRWQDIRRLSLEPELAIVPQRSIGGADYRLEPGSNRFALQFPINVIRFSEMAQNP